MRKINYKKIAIHSVLWITLIFFGYLLIDMMYIKPLCMFAYSFLNGVYISVLLTIFYIGLIKVINWIIKGFEWLFENM